MAVFCDRLILHHGLRVVSPLMGGSQVFRQQTGPNSGGAADAAACWKSEQSKRDVQDQYAAPIPIGLPTRRTRRGRYRMSPSRHGGSEN